MRKNGSTTANTPDAGLIGDASGTVSDTETLP